MKNKLSIYASVLTFCIMAMVSCNSKKITVAVELVSLDAPRLDISVGEYKSLIASVLPANATDKSLKWSSSNPSIATVDDTGRVTAIAAGTTVITVTTNDGGMTSIAPVTVSEAASKNPTAPGKPSPPRQQSGKANTGYAIFVEWTAVSEAGTDVYGDAAFIGKYEVGVKELAGKNYTYLDAGTATNLEINQLRPDTAYEFVIKAFNNAGLISESDASVEIKTKYVGQAPAKPDPPRQQSGKSNTTTSIFIEWTAVSDAGKNEDRSPSVITRYEVGVKELVSENYTYLYAGITTNFELKRLSPSRPLYPDRTYIIVVRAINSAGLISELSDAIELKTLSAVTSHSKPGTPQQKSGTTNTSNSIFVEWTAGSDAAGTANNPAVIDTYEVGYKLPTDENYTYIFAGIATAFEVTGLSPNTGYQFVVRVTNSAGLTAESDPSETLTTAP